MEPVPLPENAVRIPESPENYLLIDQTLNDGRVLLFIHEPERGRYLRFHFGTIRRPRWGKDRHTFIFYNSGDQILPATLRVLGPAMNFVAKCMEEADVKIAEIIEQQGKERAKQREEADARRQEWIERQRKEREARAERLKEVKEAVQWMVDQKFKLRRRGYKSTVFGTLQRVDDFRIYTISERGVPMTIDLDSIEYFAVKYEGDRKYTDVYTKKEEVSNAGASAS